jgi:hypothetical protein
VYTFACGDKTTPHFSDGELEKNVFFFLILGKHSRNLYVTLFWPSLHSEALMIFGVFA